MTMKAVLLALREQHSWIKKYYWLVKVNFHRGFSVHSVIGWQGCTQAEIGRFSRSDYPSPVCLRLRPLSPSSGSAVPSYTLSHSQILPTHTHTHPPLPSPSLHSLALPQPFPSWERVSQLDAHPADLWEPRGELPWQPWLMKTGSRQQAHMVVMVLTLATEMGGTRGHTSLLPSLKLGRAVVWCVRVCVCVCVWRELAGWQRAHPILSQTGYQAGSARAQPRSRLQPELNQSAALQTSSRRCCLD